MALISSALNSLGIGTDVSVGLVNANFRKAFHGEGARPTCVKQVSIV